MLTPPNQLRFQAQPTQALGTDSVLQGVVSRILHSQTQPMSFSPQAPQSPLPAPPPQRPQQLQPITLMSPDALRQASAPRQTTPISGPPVTFNSPTEQLMHLGQKYSVPFQGEKMSTYQKKVIKAIVTFKARQHGIPVNIALGIAGNESGWTMWKDLDKGEVIQGKNIRDGVLKSTDWGVMQINDKAHNRPTVFPRVKYDLEYNIDYGLSYLAKQRGRGIAGSLNLGFGDWDRTIASYNLGHNPKTERSLGIANRYVSHVHKQSMRA